MVFLGLFFVLCSVFAFFLVLFFLDVFFFLVFWFGFVLVPGMFWFGFGFDFILLLCLLRLGFAWFRFALL